MTIRTISHRALFAGESQAAKLLNAAIGLFREKGFHGTSLSDLAARTDIHKSSIYHYIHKKEDLLFAAVNVGIEWALEEAKGSLGEVRSSPSEGLKKLIAVHIRTTFERLDINWVQAHEARHLPKDDWREIVGKRNAYEALFRQTLRRGIDTGEFRADIDVDASTRLLLGSLNMIPAWWRPGGTLTQGELIDQCVTLFITGLSK